MDLSDIKKIVEAIIFVSDEPVSVKDIAAVLSISEGDIEKAISSLISDYKGRGIEIEHVADGFRFTTTEEVSEYVSAFVQDKPIRLSKHLLEVLSIVAYRQPITKKEIHSIRGKNPDGAIKSLLEKGLIEVVGRKKAPGRPKLYGTTKSFLLHFGLRSIEDLPRLEDIDGES